VKKTALDDNPYNFAEWSGTSPWAPAESHVPGAQHDRWWPSNERISGTIRLQLEARSPIFVPEGTFLPSTDPTVRRFWRCVDQHQKERPGIPGSSVKGVVRTLMETLTNSALTIVNGGLGGEDDYIEPIAYRRCSSVVWVITANSAAGGLMLQRCQSAFAKQLPGGQWHFDPDRPSPPNGTVPLLCATIDPTDRSNWQAIELRANLLWTPHYHRTYAGPPHGFHEWTHLWISVGNETATASADLVKRYNSYIDKSLAINNHLKNVENIKPKSPGRNYYKNLRDERRAFPNRKLDLKKLDVGDYVFGIPNPLNRHELECFGKNVNFMWPDEKSPKTLAGDFFPKNEKKATLAGADITQATFGFAGSYRDDGHPFRGRVRFGTFWATVVPAELGVTQLESLTAPTGVKLKARSLYLPPGDDGKTQTYTESMRLRGRKYYWHQREKNDGIRQAHRAANGGGQRPARVVPLARGTCFEGEIHFDNLTKIELGCLLASLCPDEFFGSGQGGDSYGWKIGKAKPRGLGSVHPTLHACKLREDPKVGFASPFAAPLREFCKEERDGCLNAFKAWLKAEAAKLPIPADSFEELPFYKDLERLLRLPDDSTTPYRQYPWFKQITGPAPACESAAGDSDPDPAEGRRLRPDAMRPAREIQ
jgi:CRISPR/Cas system CSM-associated protein Csm3 (group 7 of RAMP superfamily)